MTDTAAINEMPLTSESTSIEVETPPCPHCEKARRKAFPTRKRGAYSATDGTRRQRYECTNPRCRKTFTNAWEPEDRGRRTSDDEMIFKMACSGVTIRRMSILLKTSVNTVRRRMAALAARAREAHFAAMLAPLQKTSNVQFDEMETYCVAKCQPLNIAMAVRRRDGAILAAKVGIMKPHGTLAAEGKERGWGVNPTDGLARTAALQEAGMFLRLDQPATFFCDGSSIYRGLIRRTLGSGVSVESHALDKEKTHDPLFRLNHTCAKIRADLACMARDTWTTTKTVEGLQQRLDIYLAWNNGYGLFPF